MNGAQLLMAQDDSSGLMSRLTLPPPTLLVEIHGSHISKIEMWQSAV
jgi:hypothetical protein